MKNFFLVIIALCNMNIIFAQNFEPASGAPKYGNTSFNARVTNCDMLTGAASPLTDIRISAIVSDGSSPALLSEAYNTATHNIINTSSINLFYSSALFPDVCLVSRANRIWALVLYRTVAQGVCLETFMLANDTYIFSSIGVEILSTQSTKSDFLHIDSDRNDYWAATWDEGGNHTIHTCVGRTNSTGPYKVTNCNNGNTELDFPINIGSVTDLAMPDVAIYSNTGVSPVQVFLHYTYIADNKKVIVQTYSVSGNNFTAICNGNNGSLPAANVDVIESTSNANNSFINPRIATHRETNTSNVIQDGFVVLYNNSYSNGSNILISDIEGRNYFCSATNSCSYTPSLNNKPNIYTNGSLSFYGMSGTYLPAINANQESNNFITVTLDRYTGTYGVLSSNDGNNVIIGWTHGAINSSNWPVMLYANVETGQPQTPPNFSPSIKKTLFNNVSTLMNSLEYGLSVASETGNSPDILYAWSDLSTNKIVFKHVASGYKMRMANTSFQNTTASFYNDIVQQGISIPDGISSPNLQMQLTDARGVILVNANGNINILNQCLRQSENNLSAGLFVLTIYNDAALVYRSKLIKPE